MAALAAARDCDIIAEESSLNRSKRTVVLLPEMLTRDSTRTARLAVDELRATVVCLKCVATLAIDVSRADAAVVMEVRSVELSRVVVRD